MADYPKVIVDDLPDVPSPASYAKAVDEALGSEMISFNVFEVHPGERIPSGFHYHPEQEEMFYVVSGSVEFQIRDGTVVLDEGEAFLVPPGSPQKCYNQSTETAVVIAVGAPKDKAYGTVLADCPSCGEEREIDHVAAEKDGREGYRLVCAECNTEIDRFFAGPD